MKYGIDVSDNQGVIDWKKVKKAGAAFAVLRSTRGSGKTDYQFLNNVKGCMENNIPFDVYKYAYGCSEEAAAEEAETVCRLLEENQIFCTVWWDIEYKTMRMLDKDKITRIVRAAEQVVARHGFPFGIYCNKDWYENVIDAAAFDNQFWIARYPDKSDIQFGKAPDESKKPETIQELFAWQYSSYGQIDGIKTYVDLNVLYQEPVMAGIHDSNEIAENPYREPVYTLYRGRLAMDAEYVKWLQYHLVRTEYMAAYYVLKGKSCNSIDGKFGALTELAVKNFQKNHPGTYNTKEPDRKVGPKTKEALKQE